MERNLQLKLNKFDPVPHLLTDDPTRNTAVSELSVNLANLFHHYFLDNHRDKYPEPDPANFECLYFLTDTADFRFLDDGFGSTKQAKRNRSSELGQAFCRCFLHDYLNIIYFAPVEDFLSVRRAKSYGHKTFDELTVERVKNSGDAPDYLCASSALQVFAAEAKGSYDSVNFTSAKFKTWREQFDHILVKNNAGETLSLKGYIVATRYGTESAPRINSTIYAEDPNTPGDTILNDNNQVPYGNRIIAKHYAAIFEKLNLSFLAAALSSGFTASADLGFAAGLWECSVGPLEGTRFVGGYFSRLPVRNTDDLFVANPLDLMSPSPTFFGLEERIFKHMVSVARSGFAEVGSPAVFDNIEPFYSGFSVLKDGSAIGPLSFFRLIDLIRF